MSATEIISELQDAGVQLWEEGGQVRFRAPKGVMTASRIDTLRGDKQAVLDQLRSQAGLVAVVPEPQARYEPFPLTDVQAAYLLGRGPAFPYGGVGCHGYGELVLPALDPGRLEKAWQVVIDRHDMLRAVIDHTGSQRVLPAVPPYRIRVSDLSAAGPAQVAARTLEVRAEMDHRVYQAGEWPLFDLRATLTGDHVLLHMSVDFLICDFISIELMLTELGQLCRDPELTLPPLDITFRDYLLAERKLRESGRYDRDRDYWQGRLDELPSAPDLPVTSAATDAPPRFHRWQVELAPADWANLRRLAGQHGISGSGVVLAAFAEVIGRWSRNKRFTLNLTLLNRLPLHPQVGSLIGDFSSVNPLAVEQNPDVPFAERARALQAQLWQDLDHRLYSGVEVIREISRRRGPGAALMPVVFTSAIGLDGSGTESATASTAAFTRLVHGISQTPQVWIDCQNIERGGGLASNWDVREAVFPDGLVDDMFAAFTDLLQRLACAAGTWESACPVPLPESQRDRRQRVNATAEPLPDALLHEGFLARALRAPDRLAVISGAQSLSYGELLARCGSVLRALRLAGSQPHDIVAIVMEKGWEQVVAALGTLAAGAAYLPIDVDQPDARRARMLTMAGVRVVLTQSHIARSLNWPDGICVVPVDTLPAVPADRELPPSGVAPDDLAYVIYTSGSTGVPKGVMISHRSALNTIADINHRFGVAPDDVVLGLSSLGFDLSVYDIFGTLAAGGCLVLPDSGRRADPSHWAQLVAAHEVTVWNSVPALLQMLHDHLLTSSSALPSLRLAMLSGDWIPVALPGQIRPILPRLRLVSLGGATEAAIWSIYHPIEDVPAASRSIPYGKPLANQAFHVLDGTMQPCPDWVTGELYISGAGLALGYLHDEHLTATRFIRHPATGERLYRTGDLGRYLPYGSIEFLGREDSQIKIRGHRIELAEIEAALDTFPAVARGAAIAVGESPLQRRVVAFAESSRQPEPARDKGAAAALTAAASAAGEDVLAGVEEGAYSAYTRGLDEVALTAMITALRQCGLFGEPASAHSLTEILAAGAIAPRHHRLVRRWLIALQQNGLLAKDQAGRYQLSRPVGESALADGWHRVDELLPAGGAEAELVRYFQASTDHLAALLHGTQDPVRLLFPEGKLETSANLYEDALFNRWANRAAAAAVRHIAEHRPGRAPLRILEIGAGGGGTTASVVAALSGCAVDYMFTDLSQFFLNQARERFRDYSWMRYGVLDMDECYLQQGFAPNSFDVIVAGDMLHATRHVPNALRRISELLAPGGWLVLLEMTRDHYQIMTSLELLVRLDETTAEFEDERRDRDQTFLSPEQWLRLLPEAGGATRLCLPEARSGDGLMAQLGMRVLAAQFKTDREQIDLGELTSHLAGLLPDYMLPASVYQLDSLPLSVNSKIDRRALTEWIPKRPAQAQLTSVSKEPKDELEATLTAIWADLLHIGTIDREQSFFALGGDSLLAAQLAGRLLDEVPEAKPLFFDEVLRQLLEEPTVAALAARLRVAQPDAAESPSVAAQPATAAQAGAPNVMHLHSDGAAPVWALIPGAGAPASEYRELAAGLGLGTVIGLEDPSVVRYPDMDPAALRERVAAGYARLLAEHRRLRLVGCGLGGVLAVETARQLAENGVDIEQLVVISSHPAHYQIEDELLIEYLYARSAGADTGRLGFPPDAALAHALLTIHAETGSGVPDGALAGVRGSAALDEVAACWKRMAVLPGRERIAVATGYQQFRQSLRVAGSDRVAEYAGDITVLRPAQQAVLWPQRHTETRSFWERLCLGELRVADIPGDCFSCLSPGNLAGVAAVIASLPSGTGL